MTRSGMFQLASLLSYQYKVCSYFTSLPVPKFQLQSCVQSDTHAFCSNICLLSSVLLQDLQCLILYYIASRKHRMFILVRQKILTCLSIIEWIAKFRFFYVEPRPLNLRNTSNRP